MKQKYQAQGSTRENKEEEEVCMMKNTYNNFLASMQEKYSL